MSVAQVIYQQMGGNRFKVMTGAKNFVSGKDALTFSIPKSKGVNKVRITLTPDDLYTVEFFNLRGVNIKLIEKFEGVYCEMLQDIFEKATGLYTRF